MAAPNDGFRKGSTHPTGCSDLRDQLSRRSARPRRGQRCGSNFLTLRRLRMTSWNSGVSVTSSPPGIVFGGSVGRKGQGNGLLRAGCLIDNIKRLCDPRLYFIAQYVAVSCCYQLTINFEIFTAKAVFMANQKEPTHPSIFGRSRGSVESAIVADFEQVAYRRGLRIRNEEADVIRGFASTIAEHVLGRGGAGRREPDGRRYSARERDANLDSALRLARRVAERAVERARGGKAETVEEELWIGSQRMRYRTTSALFSTLCPPPLPPIC